MKNILFVEDEEMIRESIEKYLEIKYLNTYFVKSVDTVDKALSWLDSGYFDILITDYDLYNETSEEIIKTFLAQDPKPEKLIVQSGNPDAKKMADKYGGIFLQKPYKFDLLKEALEK